MWIASISKIKDWQFKFIEIYELTIPNSVKHIGESVFFGGWHGQPLKLVLEEGLQFEYIDEMAFAYYHAVNIYNYTDYQLEIGSLEFGELAKFAESIYNKDGSVQYLNEEKFKIIETEDGFKFKQTTENGVDYYTLIAYIGTKDTITLPDNIFNNSYQVNLEKCTAKHIIVPQGFETIGKYSQYIDVETITIPSPLRTLGSSSQDA